MSDREALKGRIDDLSPMGVLFVARMVESLAERPSVRFPDPGPTWIRAEPDVAPLTFPIGLPGGVLGGLVETAGGSSSIPAALRSEGGHRCHCDAVGPFVGVAVGGGDHQQLRGGPHLGLVDFALHREQ